MTGPPERFDADELAAALAAALLDGDEEDPPRLVVHVNGWPREVTGVVYDPVARTATFELDGRTRRPLSWLRPDDDVTHVSSSRSDAVEALRFAYGGYVTAWDQRARDEELERSLRDWTERRATRRGRDGDR